MDTPTQTTDLPNDTMDLADLDRIFNAPNLSRWNPIIEAARLGNARRVKKLLDSGADMYAPTCAGRFGQTAAEVAASRGRADVLSVLIKGGYDVNRLSAGGETLLAIAARNNQPAVAKLLIKAGADVNKVDAQGRPPLFECAQAGSVEVAQTLIAGGADIQFQTRHETPLICAVQNNRLSVADVLISHGADVNKPNGYGETPLMFAVSRGNTQFIGHLLQTGADVNRQNNSGETALFYVNDINLKYLNMPYYGGYSHRQPFENAYLGHVQKKVVFMLNAYKANLNHQDKDGNTFLARAALSENADLACFLIHLGASPEVRNATGSSVFEVIPFQMKPVLAAAVQKNKAPKTRVAAQGFKSTGSRLKQMKVQELY